MTDEPVKKEGQGKTILLAVLFGVALTIILLLITNAALKGNQPAAETKQSTTTGPTTTITELQSNESAKAGDQPGKALGPAFHALRRLRSLLSHPQAASPEWTPAQA